MTNPQTPHYPQHQQGGPEQGVPQQAGPSQQYSPQHQPNQPQQYSPQQPQQQFAPAQPQRQARPRTDDNGVPYGIGVFTLREVLFLGVTTVVFIASFLPFIGGDYVDFFGYSSAWAPAPWLAIPAALVLVAAAALIVARRLAPARALRIGSLSVDQFASAASVVTAGFYLGALFLVVGFTAWFGGDADLLLPGAGVIVGLLFSLLAVTVTTLGPVIPLFSSEFSARAETGAHRVARQAAAVPVRPRVERPAAQQPGGYPGQQPGGYPGQQPGGHPGQQAGGYPGQTGLPPQAPGPGEYAAYQRRGSQQAAPLPGDSGAQGSADSPVAHPVDPSPDAQSFAPGFVATDIPAVDPGVVAAPASEVALARSDSDQNSNAVDRLNIAAAPAPVPAPVPAPETQPEFDVVAEPEAEPLVEPEAESLAEPEPVPGETVSEPEPESPSGPAPVSAFNHVSAQAAAVEPDGASAGPVDAPASPETEPAAHEAEPESDAAGEPEPEPEPAAEPVTTAFSTQPFWVYSPVPRPVTDEETGATVFEIGPTAWALAIIDRGTELVIRHDDGRIGVLTQLDGITRG